MKPFVALLLPLALATSTLAQPAAPEYSGHDHAPAKIPATDESAVDYMWRKADEAFHEGDYERAIGLNKGIVALAPDEVESYGNAAWLLWSLGRGEEAIALIERGVRANPQNWEMWREAAQHYGLQKKEDKARDAYQKAVQFAPPGADTQMLRRALAHAAEASGDLGLALSTWRQLVKEFPDEAVNRNNLARVEKLAGGSKTMRTSALPLFRSLLQLVF